MKANELRVGNYHKFEGISIPRLNISSVKIGGQAYSAITGYGIYLVESGKMKFDPIPLTEEWLLRLGFLQCRENTAGKTYAIYIDGIRFDDTMIVFGSSTGLFWRKNMVMESVHQVQNLYFGLTGQELELNGEAFLK